MSSQMKLALRNLEDPSYRLQAEHFFATADRPTRVELAREARNSIAFGVKAWPSRIAGCLLFALFYASAGLIVPGLHHFLGSFWFAFLLTFELSVAMEVLAFLRRGDAARYRKAIALCGGAWAANISLELLSYLPHSWISGRGEKTELVRAELIAITDGNVSSLAEHPEELSKWARMILRKWARKPDSLAPWQSDLLAKFEQAVPGCSTKPAA